MMTNYTSSHTQAHLHGPVETNVKFYPAADSVTKEPYGTVNIRAGQVVFTFFVLKSEDAEAIKAAFGELAADLAIEEVEQANERDAEAAAEQAAAEQRAGQTGPRRVCCDSREDEPHEDDCSRPFFHYNRDELAALIESDPEARREWDIRNGEVAAMRASGAQ